MNNDNAFEIPSRSRKNRSEHDSRIIIGCLNCRIIVLVCTYLDMLSNFQLCRKQAPVHQILQKTATNRVYSLER
jgi:hypothetical protein